MYHLLNILRNCFKFLKTQYFFTCSYIQCCTAGMFLDELYSGVANWNIHKNIANCEEIVIFCTEYLQTNTNRSPKRPKLETQFLPYLCPPVVLPCETAFCGHIHQVV